MKRILINLGRAFRLQQFINTYIYPFSISVVNISYKQFNSNIYAACNLLYEV